MSISGIGSTNTWGSYFATSNANASLASTASQSSTTQTNSIEQQFLNYMKESPEQHLIDAWLKAHNLSQSALDKMSPQQRQSLSNEMADDIKREMQQKAEASPSSKLNILA